MARLVNTATQGRARTGTAYQLAKGLGFLELMRFCKSDVYWTVHDLDN